MKKSRISHFAASLLLLNQGAFALPNYFAVTGIPETSSLTLRAWPSQISKPLLAIPTNTSPIEATGKSIVLDNHTWLQINYGDQTGWVESIHLAPANESAPDVAQAPDEPQAPAELSYFAAPEVQPEAETAKTETADSAEVFNYGQAPTAEPTPIAQVSPESAANGVPWSKAADTIYDDPNADRRTYSSELADNTIYSALAPENTDVIVDLRNENIAGNRYEHEELINQ